MDPSDRERNDLYNGAPGGQDGPTHANAPLGEGWLRSVVENSSEIVTVVDADGTLRYANPAWARVLGHDYEQAVGTMNVLDHVHPDDLAHVLEETEEALAKGGVVTNQAEYRFRRKDGSWLWMQSVGTYLLDDPQVGGVVVVSRNVTERKEAEEALHLQAQLLGAVGEAVIALDADRKVVYWNRAAEEMYGFSSEEVLGRRMMDRLVPEDLRTHAEEVMAGVRAGLSWKGEFVVRRKDGTPLTVEASNTPVLDEHGGQVGVVGVLRDVTERKEAEEALRRSESELFSVLESITDGFFILDRELRFAYVNPQAALMMERTREDLVGEKLWEDATFYPEYRRAMAEGRTVEFEAYYPPLKRWYGVRAYPSQSGLSVYFQDVTERKALEKRLRHQSLHDSLTGLPNRRLFVDRLGQALGRTRRRDRLVAILFTDLDDFKVVNDSLGHDTGDKLLVEVAKRLGSCLRPEDTLARFGGDEFTVLIEDLEVPDGAVRVAERIVEELREPFLLEGRELYVAASIGVALGSAGTKDAEELLREADTAMYRAKDQGSDHEVFDTAMHGRAVDRLELENDLRRAIEQNEFVVHYQPIISLQTGELWGMEALVRWEHPERGLLNPDEFVPVAEESGLVVPMGELVLEEACRRAVEWQREFPGNPPLAMSVNLSGRQLRRPDLPETIGRALTESGLSASSLGLDITETVYISALEANTAALDRLRALGIRICLDDFGSGYSSLSYLKRLPADILKVDKSFTKGLGLEVEDTAIVQTVVDLAHILGMEVVAEGVEVEEQETLLREMGCDFAQGYLFSRPLPPEAVSEFLAN